MEILLDSFSQRIFPSYHRISWSWIWSHLSCSISHGKSLSVAEKYWVISRRHSKVTCGGINSCYTPTAVAVEVETGERRLSDYKEEALVLNHHHNKEERIWVTLNANPWLRWISRRFRATSLQRVRCVRACVILLLLMTLTRENNNEKRAIRRH